MFSPNIYFVWGSTSTQNLILPEAIWILTRIHEELGHFFLFLKKTLKKILFVLFWNCQMSTESNFKTILHIFICRATISGNFRGNIVLNEVAILFLTCQIQNFVKRICFSLKHEFKNCVFALNWVNRFITSENSCALNFLVFSRFLHHRGSELNKCGTYFKNNHATSLIKIATESIEYFTFPLTKYLCEWGIFDF